MRRVRRRKRPPLPRCARPRSGPFRADRIPRPSGRPMSLRVTSEIGKLSSVLVHLPGPEIDRMVPSMMEELLFDDILFGERAREEHRRFQQVLGHVTEEVLEVQDLLAEVLAVREHRDAILEDLGRSLSWGEDMGDRLRDFSAEGLAAALIAGIEKPPQEAARYASELYWLPPIPNYFFQRDPLVVVGNRAVRCSMATPARRREPLLTGYFLGDFEVSMIPSDPPGITRLRI